ncbi:MAG: hypothetical protein WC584_00545 [Candidatus Pacearchaeota archaeon]
MRFDRIFIGNPKGNIERVISGPMILDEDGNPVKEEKGEYGKSFLSTPKQRNIIYPMREEELVPEYAGSPILVPRREIRKH